ncbi:MAG: 4-alpha-glucanotransferase [Acutalibacteraceae bacterium]
MLLKGEENKKERGILLAISSLPSDYGIGSFGEEAYNFVDFLNKTEQTCWQILPLCPLGKDNSPYASSSCFAGEILYIDIDLLIKDGLLKKSDIEKRQFQKNVDYETVRKFKLPLIKKATQNFDTSSNEFAQFLKKNSFWLDDYALFMAIKENCQYKPFCEWEEGLKYRHQDVLEEFRQTHEKEIMFYQISQFFFFSQYERLKTYANDAGIEIIGDIPFYVSLESADVWANPENFKLSLDMTPTCVAGVPPDIFSKTGQLWGNPIYDWQYLKKTDYLWWRKRLIHSARLYDTIRIDHFRAFGDYYSINYKACDATVGKWEIGAGMEFFESVNPYIKDTKIIAEDLGGENSPIVQKLVAATGFPNMKVLQFAFSSDLGNPFLPDNFGHNCVCYTGTHDNDTTNGWYEKAEDKERLLFNRLVPGEQNASPALRLIAYAMKSKARTVIIPFQDYLELGSEGRMNIPGTAEGNWEWRFEKQDINSELINKVLYFSFRE